MPIYQPSSPVYGRDYRRYDWINALGKGFDLYGDYYRSFAFASFMGAINLLVLLRFLARINNKKVAIQ